MILHPGPNHHRLIDDFLSADLKVLDLGVAKGRSKKKRGSARKRAKKKGVGRVRRLSGLAVRWTIVGLLVALVAVATAVGWNWPDFEAVRQGPVRSSAFIQGYITAHGKPPKIAWRRYAALDKDLKLAVLVAEDARFFEHGAFDPTELRKALSDRLMNDRRLRGASTLTQQLAKNLWLSSKRSMLRKAREAAYAVTLEQQNSKERILEIYLNVVEMGPGVFGAEAAAQHFFGSSASDLTPKQAAQLAATLSRPYFWYPGVASESYKNRVQHILQEMERSPGVAKAL